ncbi:transcription factor FapR [Pyramidobacter sp. C12-8]|uniref:transcription factor FapR n=1 Tax=Pyramidobacter sp. C12-8 TaxID=1943580 RepID=UPI00098EEFA5|nr:transcription factor FapR [Pyramidobacter sp. C12-8]OON89931.1 transcription factor [Pyramidobacter sp. C12-8]
MSLKNGKLKRHEKLFALMEQNPLYTDEDLARLLKVSLSTIRLDRALMGVPELRERTRQMAERAVSRLRSLKQEEFIGELLGLEPNVWALSMLQTTKEMAFRHTDQVWDQYIYAQASTLAIAVVEADMVVVQTFRGRYSAPAVVGDRLVARAKVGVHEGDKYIVSVHTNVGDREIYVGRFIVRALSSGEESTVSAVRGNEG